MVSLTAFQYSKDFSDEISGNTSKRQFLGCTMKGINIWEFCIIQGTHNPGTHGECYKITRVWEICAKYKTDQWVLMRRGEKFIDWVSGSALQQAFKQLPLVEFWCSIKEMTHNHPEKLQRCLSASSHMSVCDWFCLLW